MIRTGTKNNGSCMIFVKSHHVPGTENWQVTTWTNSQSTTLKKRKVRQMWNHVVGMESTYGCTGRAFDNSSKPIERRQNLSRRATHGLRLRSTAGSGYLLLLLVKHQGPLILLVGEILQITAIRLPESGKCIIPPPPLLQKKIGK